MPSCAPYALFCLHNVVQIDYEFALEFFVHLKFYEIFYVSGHFISVRDYNCVDMKLKNEFNFIKS